MRARIRGSFGRQMKFEFLNSNSRENVKQINALTSVI